MTTTPQQLTSVPEFNTFISLPFKYQVAMDVVKCVRAVTPRLPPEIVNMIIKSTWEQTVNYYLEEEGVYIFAYIKRSQDYKKHVTFSVGRLNPEVIPTCDVIGYNNESINKASYICVKAKFSRPMRGFISMYTVDLVSSETFLVASINMQQDGAMEQKQYIHTVIMQRMFEENLRHQDIPIGMIEVISYGELATFMISHYENNVNVETFQEIYRSQFMRDRSCMNIAIVCVEGCGFIEVLPTCIYNHISERVLRIP
jgi:hypothetical protein